MESMNGFVLVVMSSVWISLMLGGRVDVMVRKMPILNVNHMFTPMFCSLGILINPGFLLDKQVGFVKSV